MHIDYNVSVNSLPKMVDFCVVGSGPAGMTVALELEDYGRTVILLEGGGLDQSVDSQDIYKGDVIGDHYHALDVTRLRYLGGTSGHWLGWCFRLTEDIFQKREGYENTHWPIEKKDVDPFLGKALSILDVPQMRDEVVVDSEFGIKEINISKSRVRFGQKYRERLNSSEKVTLVTNANFTGLKTDGHRVLSATVTNYAGRAANVKAKYFILAMGGIENSRMLLWCNNQTNGKVVDPRAPLGRYWMEHIDQKIGHAVVDFKITRPENSLPELVLGLTSAVKRKLSILDCGFILSEIPSEGGTKGLIKDLLCVAPKAGEWAASLAKKNIACGALLSAEWEQEPIWNNHVKLSETKRDRFGIPLTELHWKKTVRDYATLEKSLSQLNDYLLTRNRGRIKLDDWVFSKDGYIIGSGQDDIGNHHMGGTRMANTVENGVVDSNCRVFGQDNLYVAGSSIYPSAGAANPTLLIVQLSLRLAEHLRYA